MGSNTRERILATAARRFTEQGYDATSLREIAEDLGITKAALYYHFRAKDEIFAALIQPLADLIEELISRLEQAEDLAGWAEAVDWIIDQLIAHQSEFTLLQRNRPAIETAQLQEELFSGHQRMHERVEEVVTRAGSNLAERVRMVASLGAVTGFDDWAPILLAQTDPRELSAHLRDVAHDILGVHPD